MLKDRFEVSKRRACQVLRQPRATQRYLPKVRDDEQPLTRRIIEPASIFGRYRYRQVTALLRLDGWWVNHKRVERIWRREGLTVPKKQPKFGRLRLNGGSCIRLRAERRDHVWACEFVHGRTHEGRSFRMLRLVDEYTSECLAIDVPRQLNSEDVLERLAWLIATRGVQDHIRSDNGPEFTAAAVVRVAASRGRQDVVHHPGITLGERLRGELQCETGRRAAGA